MASRDPRRFCGLVWSTSLRSPPPPRRGWLLTRGIVILRKKNHLHSILLGSRMGRREAELFFKLGCGRFWEHRVLGESGRRVTPSVSLFSHPQCLAQRRMGTGAPRNLQCDWPHGSLAATWWDSGLCIKTISRHSQQSPVAVGRAWSAFGDKLFIFVSALKGGKRNYITNSRKQGHKPAKGKALQVPGGPPQRTVSSDGQGAVEVFDGK